ncbi:hypothetical protein Nepgr_025468 [Nepenthes gracilis]|uniref:Enoyl reductase (ER) domain-containing protein n=1 Tax=Nepenthes gracilis TaxID=150966 RepID=A0AAD3Y136_NEPGR|nr:hypothetical protein Nepgr_025468 [Nepenthes gracilis]
MGSVDLERTTTGWAARDASGLLSPFRFPLRNTGVEDVYIKVMSCGICHTDLHQAKNDLGMSRYPMVPGHEVVGEVLEVGSGVSKFKVGDVVGVGCIVGCCGACNPCESDEEQYCKKKIWTYNDVYTDGKPTQGGFSAAMVVDQKFVVKIPDGMDPEQAAPLLCAGLTVYSPLKHFGLSRSGLRGGILGLGGVGHMAVKIAKAMGHHVTVISSSDKKREEALAHLGADGYLVSSDTSRMNELAGSLDYIFDTVPAFHPLEPCLSLLKLNGQLILVGVVNTPLQFMSPAVMSGRKSITGSFIGSMKEAEELMQFCKEKELTSQIETVKMEYVNEAFRRLEKNDVRYRFVIDVAGSKLDQELQAHTEIIAAAAAGVATECSSPRKATAGAENVAQLPEVLVENAIVIVMLVEDHLRLQSKLHRGKTTLTLHMIAVARTLVENIMLLEAEHTFDAAYPKPLCGDVKHLIICQPNKEGMAFELANSLCQSGAIHQICVDSVLALTPCAEIEDPLLVEAAREDPVNQPPAWMMR